MSAESFGSSFPTSVSAVPSSEAQSIISSAQGHANVALSTALSYLDKIVVPAAPAPVSAEFVQPMLSGFSELPAPPNAPDLGLNSITVPAAPAFPALVTPTLSGGKGIPAPERPAFLSYPIPDALTATLPEQPEITPVALPTAPLFTLPAVPKIIPITIPSAPTIDIPGWAAARPMNELSDTFVPTTVRAMAVGLSDVAETVKEQVMGLLLGGRGLPPEVEQMIWERARSREDIASSKLVQEASEEFAGRGFSLPPGALAGRIAEARKAGFDKVVALSREVLIKATDTQLDMYKHGLAQSIAYEQVCLEASKTTAAHALEASKATAELGVRLYEAMIRTFEADVHAYNTEAQVYGERIKAAMSQVGIYNALIEGEKAKSEVNRTTAMMYGEQLKGVLAEADVYRAKMDGVKAQIEQNLGTIQMFKALTEGYAAQVGAKKSEYEAWGEGMKVNSYIAQSYTAEVQGYAERMKVVLSQDQMQLAKFDGEIRRNEGLARQFLAQVEAVRAQIQHMATTAEAKSRIYSGQAAIFSAQGAATASANTVRVAQYSAQGEANKAAAQVALSGADSTAKNVLAHAQITVEATRGASQAAASMAAGAMSAVHAGANVSSSVAAGSSRVWTSTAAVTDSTSLAE